MLMFFNRHKCTTKSTFQMIVYNQYEDTVTNGSEIIALKQQILPARSTRSPLAAELASKMPHLSLSDILFIAAVVNLPDRAYGSIVKLATYYSISRVSVYELGKRVVTRLAEVASTSPLLLLPEPAAKEAVSKARIDRTILTTLFPGNASIRPTRAILQTAFDTCKSVGYINNLRLEAGQRAGTILMQVNYAPLGSVIALRDETFFQGQPILLLVDPITTSILAAHVTPDCQADTWAVALLLAKEQGLMLSGLTEDMATMYDKSLKLADMTDVSQQKDVWHLERDGGKVRNSLKKSAYAAISAVLALEKVLLKAWDDTIFDEQYIPTVDKESKAIEQYDEFAECLGHLCDALELVDTRSGEIRDVATSQWFLEEVVTTMQQIEHKRVKQFSKTIRNHQAQLLTFLARTAQALLTYDNQLSPHIPDERVRLQFIRAVARSWKLDQMLINGHRQWKAAAKKAAILVQSVINTDALWAKHALALRRILDNSGRTSSLIESINSLLKAFFKSRKGFKNQVTMQAFLNLFVLWHNMRVYDPRSKRGGKSPFQLAGIDLGNDDWLTLLGYRPAN